MKTINYKGIELEVHDSTVIHTYGNRGNVDIEFNKPIYSFEGRTFYSLDEVDKYLGKEVEIVSLDGFKISRQLPTIGLTKKYSTDIAYIVQNAGIIYTMLPTFEMALRFVNAESKPKSQNDIPNQFSTNDNRLAIKMLNSVSEILSAIESDDAELIELNLTELKERVDKFEKVYYDNKRNGVYE